MLGAQFDHTYWHEPGQKSAAIPGRERPAAVEEPKTPYILGQQRLF